MKFDLLYELQMPKPHDERSEYRCYHEALEQIELADKLGYDTVWEVEHHFLTEFAHSSAPEVFLAAAAARTKRIRIGHGVVLLPHRFNHPMTKSMTRDPVCGMELEDSKIVARSTYLGCSYAFCSEACKIEFDKNPRQYLSDSALGS